MRGGRQADGQLQKQTDRRRRGAGSRDTERQRRRQRVRQGETEMHAVRQTEEARVGRAVSETQRGARSRGPEA